MKTKLTLRVYRDKKKELRWTLIAGNNEKLCSGEGYKRRSSLEKACVLTFLGAFIAHGSKKLSTVFAFREDIRLEDLTEFNETSDKRCQNNTKCK